MKRFTGLFLGLFLMGIGGVILADNPEGVTVAVMVPVPLATAGTPMTKTAPIAKFTPLPTLMAVATAASAPAKPLISPREIIQKIKQVERSTATPVAIK
jgi:hypothetical protein